MFVIANIFGWPQAVLLVLFALLVLLVLLVVLLISDSQNWGLQFARGTQNLKSYQKSPHKGNKRGLLGIHRGSIWIWGYAKRVNFDFGEHKGG
jgi:hypothetical protein